MVKQKSLKKQKQVLVFDRIYDHSVRVEESNESGKFLGTRADVDIESEEPVILSTPNGVYIPYPLGTVKLLTGKNAEAYWKIREEKRQFHLELDILLDKALNEEKPITWDWMTQHQSCTRIPIPFQHRTEIKKFRKGSWVVISGSSSTIAKLIGAVGRIIQFNPKYAVIELEDGRLKEVPYIYLKPVNSVSEAELNKQRKQSEIALQIATLLKPSWTEANERDLDS